MTWISRSLKAAVEMKQKTLHYIKKTRRRKRLITRLLLHLEKINLT